MLLAPSIICYSKLKVMEEKRLMPLFMTIGLYLGNAIMGIGVLIIISNTENPGIAFPSCIALR